MGCETVADTSYSFFDFHSLEIWKKKTKNNAKTKAGKLNRWFLNSPVDQHGRVILRYERQFPTCAPTTTQ